MSETKTKNLCTVPAADLNDSQYFIAEDGGELKRIPKAQVVLKKLEKMLATDTENLAGGGEVTAQELLDALAEQVANKLLAKSQVVNNLLATVEGNPLDATQGKALKELIDTTNNNLSNKADKTSLSNYVSKDDLGIYFTADGSKAAVYKQNVISVSIQLKAGYTYFLVGKMVYPFQTMDRCQQRLMYCPMQVAFSILEILAQRCLMAAVV